MIYEYGVDEKQRIRINVLPEDMCITLVETPIDNSISFDYVEALKFKQLLEYALDEFNKNDERW